MNRRIRIAQFKNEIDQMASFFRCRDIPKEPIQTKPLIQREQWTKRKIIRREGGKVV